MNEEDFFASIEEAHFEAISSQPDYERVYLSERDMALRNCWSSFQESATSIAQLYKGKKWILWCQCTFFCRLLGRFTSEKKNKNGHWEFLRARLLFRFIHNSHQIIYKSWKNQNVVLAKRIACLLEISWWHSVRSSKLWTERKNWRKCCYVTTFKQITNSRSKLTKCETCVKVKNFIVDKYFVLCIHRNVLYIKKNYVNRVSLPIEFVDT